MKCTVSPWLDEAPPSPIAVSGSRDVPVGVASPTKPFVAIFPKRECSTRFRGAQQRSAYASVPGSEHTSTKLPPGP